MPLKVQLITNTFLTDTHDLYIAVESKDKDIDVFEIYHLDLDEDNPSIKSDPILRYPFTLVG